VPPLIVSNFPIVDLHMKKGDGILQFYRLKYSLVFFVLRPNFLVDFYVNFQAKFCAYFLSISFQNFLLFFSLFFA